MGHLPNLGMNRANKLPIQPRDIFRMTSGASRGQGMNRALATERARCHFDRLAEDSNKTKLLEHPCFPGESLNFQNNFFSSNYMDLPGSIASPIALMIQDAPVDSRRFVFAYHAHYRKECKDLIDSFRRDAMKKSELYVRQTEKLRKRPDGMEQMLSLDRMARNDLGLRRKAFGFMVEAYHDNDYPEVLSTYQEYHNMPKSY